MAKQTIEKRRGAGGESAYIAGSRVRVSDIARLYQLTQEELIIERMQRSLPDLSMEQLADALRYWRDHIHEIDEEIREEEAILAKMPLA